MCILASGVTILLLLSYRDPDGIRIDSVGTNKQKWLTVSNNVMCLTWFLENKAMALPDVFPVEWCMYVSSSTHTQMRCVKRFCWWKCYLYLVRWTGSALSTSIIDIHYNKRTPIAVNYNCTGKQLLYVYKCRAMVHHRADSSFASSQWETALLCNDVSHWLGAILESALHYNIAAALSRTRTIAWIDWYQVTTKHPSTDMNELKFQHG